MLSGAKAPSSSGGAVCGSAPASPPPSLTQPHPAETQGGRPGAASSFSQPGLRLFPSTAEPQFEGPGRARGSGDAANRRRRGAESREGESGPGPSKRLLFPTLPATLREVRGAGRSLHTPSSWSRAGTCRRLSEWLGKGQRGNEGVNERVFPSSGYLR